MHKIQNWKLQLIFSLIRCLKLWWWWWIKKQWKNMIEGASRWCSLLDDDHDHDDHDGDDHDVDVEYDDDSDNNYHEEDDDQWKSNERIW